MVSADALCGWRCHRQTTTPGVVAQYYVDCIKQLRGTARVVRADCGTENIYVAAIQRFLETTMTMVWLV
jgi:hypothetical protein